MYLRFTVSIPEVPGKITYRRKGGSTYVEYEVERTYDPARKFTIVKRSNIGKMDEEGSGRMYPNQNYMRLFPEAELPEESGSGSRSSCLRAGAHMVIGKAVGRLGLTEALEPYFDRRDMGLLLDLAAYSIVEENNAGQHYPAYSWCHPLFTDGMRMYSDSTVSDFLRRITREQATGFLNEWNGRRNHRERVYLSYDSTNKNCQAGDIEIVEYGKAKVDVGQPVFNYAIAYDTRNREPLFYERYPGSVNDVSQFRHVVERTVAYGYRHTGFILDRGYFSKENITAMDDAGYSFVMMVKGMNPLVSELVRSVRGTFEEKWSSYIPSYGLYGTTVKAKLFATDRKERWFHIFHSHERKAAEVSALTRRIGEMKAAMKAKEGHPFVFSGLFGKYFDLFYDEKDGRFMFGLDRPQVIDGETGLCGYFVIVTSERMDAEDAVTLYKGRDVSEKLFRGDKSYLGNGALRVQSDEAASAKIFIEFIALIIRSHIYSCLSDEMRRTGKRPNWMTVPAAIRELEKIEMSRQFDGVYRLDHAVTRTQKEILGAFGMDRDDVRRCAASIADALARK